MRSKVNELGVFAIGIGLIFALLTLLFAADSSSSASSQSMAVQIALGVCAAFIILGGLTLALRNRVVICFTTVLVVLGLLYDLLLAFGLIKLCISGLIIGLVVNTGREAINEVGADVDVEGEGTAPPIHDGPLESISFSCTRCGHALELEGDLAGTLQLCSGCGRNVMVPSRRRA